MINLSSSLAAIKTKPKTMPKISPKTQAKPKVFQKKSHSPFFFSRKLLEFRILEKIPLYFTLLVKGRNFPPQPHRADTESPETSKQELEEGGQSPKLESGLSRSLAQVSGTVYESRV